MKSSWVAPNAGLMLLMMLTAALLGGCKTRAQINQLCAEDAWEEVAKEKGITGFVGRGIEIFVKDRDGNGVDISPQVRHLQEEAEEASKDPRTPVKALEEIIDDVSTYLVEELPQVHQVADAEWRMTLALGTLVDKSEDQVLGTALNRIAVKLNKNKEFRRRFKVLSSTKSEAESILRELGGAHPEDIFGPGYKGDTGVSTVHPDDLFVLTGHTDVFKERDGLAPVLKVTTFIEVTHPKTREVVLSQDFVKTYYFHPTRRHYISELENEKLASTSKR